MEQIKNLLEDYKLVVDSLPAKSYSKEKQLLKEIYEFFGKPKDGFYFTILNNVKLRGADWVRECFEIQKKSDKPSSIGIFFWRLKQAKTMWDNSGDN